VIREATADKLKEQYEAELVAERMAANEVAQQQALELSRLSKQLEDMRKGEASALALKELQLKGIHAVNHAGEADRN
jgi:hypothetical protein